MIRMLAAMSFAFAMVTAAEAMTPTPIPQPDGLTTQVAYGCGPGRTRRGGICVARTTIRHYRRAARRCAFWHGGGCGRWYY